MKKIVLTSLGVAAVALFASMSATAQVTVFSETFDPLTAGHNLQDGFTFGDTTSSSSGVVAGVGVGGTSGWETVDTAASGTAGFSGVGAQFQDGDAAGNTSANLGDYILSFDAMATTTGGNASALTINIQTWSGAGFGGTQSGNGLVAGANGNGAISLPSSFTHFSLNLGDTSVFQTENAGFTPLGGTIQVTMQLGGGGATPYTDTLIVDNFTLTQVPEPSSLALGAVGALSGLMMVVRRRKA